MGNFISEAWDSITGQSGADAATQAGQIQADAIRQASGIGAANFQQIQNLINQQLGLTTQQIAPFVGAGQQAISGLPVNTQQFGQQLGNITGTDMFADLVNQRMLGVQGMLGAGGLTRSGAAITEGAAIPTDVALQLQQQLAGQQLGAGQLGLSAMGQTGSLQEALIRAMMGQNEAVTSGIIGAAEAQAGGLIGGAQAQAAGMGNLTGLGGMLGAAYIMAPAASDPRLKENIVKIGKIGPLNLYQWDYIEEIRDLEIARFNTGFMADEVEEIYPEHVVEFAGYKLIKYGDLIDALTV